MTEQIDLAEFLLIAERLGRRCQGAEISGQARLCVDWVATRTRSS